MEKVVEELFESVIGMLGKMKELADETIIEMSYIMGKAANDGNLPEGDAGKEK